MEEPDGGVSPPDMSEIFFGSGPRPKATQVMRERAKRMEEKAKRIMVEAAQWRQLAKALDEIEEEAKKQCVDGSEAGPHIGVGSDAETLLWKLAYDHEEGSWDG